MNGLNGMNLHSFFYVHHAEVDPGAETKLHVASAPAGVGESRRKSATSAAQPAAQPAAPAAQPPRAAAPSPAAKAAAKAPAKAAAKATAEPAAELRSLRASAPSEHSVVDEDVRCCVSSSDSSSRLVYASLAIRVGKRQA